MWAFLDVPAAQLDTATPFWSAATGTSPSARRGARNEFLTLVPREDDPCLSLQAVGGGGGVHVDLDVVDLSGATSLARRHGATVLRELDDVVVAESPGGFLFCLTRWAGESQVAPTIRWDTGGASVLDQVCLDIPSSRYAAEVAFWSALTGWEVGPDNLEEFQHLRVPLSLPLRTLLQQLDEESGPVRAHLDFACSDPVEEVARHQSLGAEVLRRHRLWTVMRPPAGPLYCLTDRDPAAGPAT